MKRRKKKTFDGKVLIFTAPSGSGKTTVVRHLLEKFNFLGFSVSATTREKRPHETEGKDYYYISLKDFRKKISEKAFLEWEEVYKDQYYGTLKSEVERVWSEGKHIVFDIEVNGATNLKNYYGDDALAVFIKVPTFNQLVNRLKARKTESEASLKKRIKRIKKELTFENSFDQVLINDKLDKTLEEAEQIIKNFLNIDEEE